MGMPGGIVVGGGGGGGGAPSGAAGGVLSGTYPDPGFAADMATQAELDAVAAAKANTSHAHAGEDITSGTVADARIASSIARDSEVAAAYQPLDADLTSIAALTTTSAGRGVLTKSAGTTPTTINEVVALLQTWGISS